MRTTVGIIGGGPAGLLLARLLHRAGIDCVVLEARTREYVEQRQRAGMLEQGTVDALHEAGAAERLQAEGLVHQGIELRFDRERHHIDFPALTGGRTVTIYAQTEIVKDLVALQLAEGPPLLFEAEALAVEKPESDNARRTVPARGPRADADLRLRRRLRRLPRHLPRRVPGRGQPHVRARLSVLLARHPGRSAAVLRRVDLRAGRTRLRAAQHALTVRVPALPPGPERHRRPTTGPTTASGTSSPPASRSTATGR